MDPICLLKATNDTAPLIIHKLIADDGWISARVALPMAPIKQISVDV